MKDLDLLTGLGPWTTVRVSEASSGIYWNADWTTPSAGESASASGWGSTMPQVAQQIRDWLSRIEDAEILIWESGRRGAAQTA